MLDPVALILGLLQPHAGKRILDIGCGKGTLVRKLAENGAEAIGVDPAALPAKEAVGKGCVAIERAGAERLPFAPQSFDAAVFQNSLHHVPVGLMDEALREAERVVKPGGKIVVVEPLAAGTYFQALRPIEDETEIRAAAQSVLAAAVAAGRLKEVARHDIVRRDVFDSIAPFLKRVVDVDEERGKAVAERRAEVEAAFASAAVRDAGGNYVLEQPIRAFVLVAV